MYRKIRTGQKDVIYLAPSEARYCSALISFLAEGPGGMYGNQKPSSDPFALHDHPYAAHAMFTLWMHGGKPDGDTTAHCSKIHRGKGKGLLER